MKGTKFPSLNVRGIVMAFGGGTIGTVERLRQHGIDNVTPKAVDKWIERGSLPMKRFLQMSAIAAKGDSPLILNNFLIWS